MFGQGGKIVHEKSARLRIHLHTLALTYLLHHLPTSCELSTVQGFSMFFYMFFYIKSPAGASADVYQTGATPYAISSPNLRAAEVTWRMNLGHPGT